MIKKTDQTKKGVELMIPGIVIGVIVLICNIKKQDRRGIFSNRCVIKEAL